MTPKLRAFVREYARDLNGAEAARRAGFAKANAKQQASELLQLPEIKAAIERKIAARERRTLISADRILQEYARIAFADIRDFVDWDETSVTLHPPDALSEDDAAVIAAVTRGPGGGPRLKLYDKKAALSALARHLGVFEQHPVADPSARIEAGRRVREMLLAQVAALAPETDPK